MIAYASRTGTKRNLAALRGAGWRLLVSATGVHRTEGFQYMIDCGAWTAFQQGEPFDDDAYRRVLEKLGAGADLVVLPDIVGGGMASLDLSLKWLDEVKAINPRVLLPVQDGMTPGDVDPIASEVHGIFLGGSTPWKLHSCSEWGTWARSAGAYYHFARCNSMRRIRLAQQCGADSFDGTSVTRFAVTLPKLQAALDQPSFRW